MCTLPASTPAARVSGSGTKLGCGDIIRFGGSTTTCGEGDTISNADRAIDDGIMVPLLTSIPVASLLLLLFAVEVREARACSLNCSDAARDDLCLLFLDDASACCEINMMRRKFGQTKIRQLDQTEENAITKIPKNVKSNKTKQTQAAHECTHNMN